ncbi:DgyrCDS14886 [Dimorphilus gyrociliatus]|uniref:DgyrCDS14886 n=1 Tax=Dimorphilus gyrociliatus TaxID=2664684 RepID=A0A7I8WF80_9ANNE|nr:DgyrCDS14886 [Dimorphilus gyrociliatus]
MKYLLSICLVVMLAHLAISAPLQSELMELLDSRDEGLMETLLLKELLQKRSISRSKCRACKHTNSGRCAGYEGICAEYYDIHI